jgi:hypothetical protein
MRRGLAIIAGLLLGASACMAANYYRQLLMLPRAAVASSQYQTDPYAANLIARWDFDSVNWTNDLTANGFHLTLFNPFGAVISNSVVGTNQFGRVEKSLHIVSGTPSPRRIITPGELSIWSNDTTVVSYWIYRTKTNALEYTFGFGSTNDTADVEFHQTPANSYNLAITVRSNSTTISSDGYPSSASPTNTILRNAWTHIVEVRSKTTGNLIWNNGRVIPPASSADAYRTYTFRNICNRSVASGRNPAVSFGSSPSRAQSFNGYIDNARVYNTSDATNNVMWLYLNTHPTNNLEAR